MAFGLEFYLIAAIVVLLTGVSKAGFGAGVEMLAVPVMAIFILPQTAAAIMLPILVAIDAANLWRYRHDWVKRILIMLLPSALIGIAVGAWAFEFIKPEWFKLGIGVLALLFVLQRLLMPAEGRPVRRPGKLLTSALGAMGGFTSFVAHAGSPPIKMVLLSEDLPKQQFVGTNSYLFGAINLIKCFPYFFLGQFSAQNLGVSLTLAPFVIAGVLLGFWLNGVVSQLWFTRVVFAALAIAGVKLVWDGAGLILG